MMKRSMDILGLKAIYNKTINPPVTTNGVEIERRGGQLYSGNYIEVSVPGVAYKLWSPPDMFPQETLILGLAISLFRRMEL